MRGARRAIGSAVLIALGGVMLGSPGPALADEQLLASGSLTYTWHGDPARGCARAGVCGVQGALIVRPQNGGYLRGDTLAPGDLEFNGASATVRVLRSSPRAAATECVDTIGSYAFGLALGPVRHAHFRATVQGSPSSGRCAGPVAPDLARIELPGLRTGYRLKSFHVNATEPFAAGPFSGALVSTLVLRPDTSSGASGGGSTSSSGPARSTRLIEEVVLRYRLAALPGALTTSFTGGQDPFCDELDSCGTSGSLSLSLPGYQSTLVLTGSRAVRRRVGSRRALADFRSGRLGLSGGPPSTPTGRLQEILVWPGALSCLDAVSVPDVFLDTGGAPGSSASLQVSLLNQGDGDPLRSHCPGPSYADVIGSGQTIARGASSTRRLLQRRSVLALSDPGSFDAAGYRGARGGAIRLALSLVSVKAQTRRDRVG